MAVKSSSRAFRALRIRSLVAAVTGVILSLSFGFATPAHAQDEDEPGQIVETRAPEDKRPIKVRNKFFIKRKRFEITPQVGFITNNALNDEINLGASLTYHFTDRVGVELHGSYALLGGTGNTKSLALAVLRLLDPSFRLESVDPGVVTTLSFVWSPMYGKINPFGMAVINLDFYFLLGVGYGNETVEMLSYAIDGAGQETAELATDPAINHQFLFNIGMGVNVFATKWLSLRFDVRILLTWDEVLNYDDDTAAATNRALGPLANRLTCDNPDISDKACKVVFPSAFTLNVGGSFWVPGDRAVREKASVF
mgnify:CR=1 FL=1